MVAGGSEAPIIPVGLGGFVACRWAVGGGVPACALLQAVAWDVGMHAAAKKVGPGCRPSLAVIRGGKMSLSKLPLPAALPYLPAERSASGTTSRSGRPGRGMLTAMAL